MQKTMFKTACTFMLVLFVMSVTGAAAASSSTSKPVANADKFNLSPTNKYGNVLSNDKGTGLKIATTGYIKTSKGTKVYLKNNGYAYYYPLSSFKTGTITDSFTYKIVDKYKRYSTAKVTIYYKCSSSSSTNSGTQTKSVVAVTKLSQIDSALKNGPVLLEFGASWCPHCKTLEPTLKKLATKYAGKATIMSVDVDKSSKLTDSFGVSGIPDCTVIVGTKNGKYVYMQQNGKTTTDRSKAKITDDRAKSVYEKVLNLALK